MIVRSPAPALDVPALPAGAQLRGAAAAFGDAPVLHHAGHELSFAGLLARASSFAHALHADGIGRGDVVALHLPNCPQYAVAYWGTLLAGATVTPANPLLAPADLGAQLADSGAVAALSWGAALPALLAARPGTALKRVLATGPGEVPADVTDLDAFLEGRPTAPPGTDLDLDPATDLAHLAYTGGTTGRSKGVRVTHRNVLTNALQSACWGTGASPGVRDTAHGPGVVLVDPGPPEEFPTPLGSGRAIGIAPWFHAMGTIGGLNVPLLAGSLTIVHGRFDPKAYLADATRFAVTSMSGAPPVYAALLAHRAAAGDLSSVRSLTSGAAPLPTGIIAGLREWLGDDLAISEGYGLTEVTMAATLGPAGRSAPRRPGTVGLPVAGTEIRISGHDGEELGPGAEGEVWIRGPQVTGGYLGRPADTAAAFDGDGWLHTGDVGVLDDDGFLRIVDRLKDMLLHKGYNVYPRDLEERLLAVPGVTGAAVVGRPAGVAGERPVAFLTGPTEADARAAVDELNARLLPYQRLREVHVVEAIPVSAAGKVLKRELRDQLAGIPEQGAASE
ncbi:MULTISPECIES: class I adenylate-forming enzyme family protein [unclassified Pseudonocardia]|uniref:class I adenylate-forming enzyme family protein n=1 Tax=unclassified Pseudonocardia TaxID=2619320 RepID=UPI0001FFDD75|nr:class I adenylate-forming enzyme family protein [Pseudonocardia sp. Ae707_Ps1]OLM20785.1 Long-chain-fatty-acid--CoA ligase [Pseudonocardia sp. Ae707_Ps1]